MTVTETPLPNGVNVAAILEARQHMTDMPELAQFQWRATSEWAGGVHTRTTIKDFSGAGGEQAHNKTYTFDADHPEVFAAPDAGATPVEFVLVGLTSCLTAGVASVAANRGITLESVTATIEGDMDLRGILGIDKEVRNGYEQIRVTFDVRGDASADELEALVAQSAKRSAVFDIVSNPTAVSIEVRS